LDYRQWALSKNRKMPMMMIEFSDFSGGMAGLQIGCSINKVGTSPAFVASLRGAIIFCGHEKAQSFQIGLSH
jgi:hypothetical protein